MNNMEGLFILHELLIDHVLTSLCENLQSDVTAMYTVAQKFDVSWYIIWSCTNLLIHPHDEGGKKEIKKAYSQTQ